MPNIVIMLILAFFSLYGLIEFCSMLYDKFLGNMDSGVKKYFLFIPTGNAENLETQIRSAVDFADKISCEPIAVIDILWNEETQKIAELMSRDFNFTTVYKEEFLKMTGK